MDEKPGNHFPEFHNPEKRFADLEAALAALDAEMQHHFVVHCEAVGRIEALETKLAALKRPV